MRPNKRLPDNCFLNDRDRLKHAEALAILKERVGCVAERETVRLEEAHGRILARDVFAESNVPGHDNSAVDGYAFRHGDLGTTGGLFPVAARIAAGHPEAGSLPPGIAARIFTGAVMPEGFDTVAMQEDCGIEERDGKLYVSIPAGMKPGANRRKAGEDLKAGDLLLSAGQSLRPQDIAALASIGWAEVEVMARLRVALVSTGDEIRRPGKPLGPGEVYDSNHFLLRALLETLGVSITDCGVLPDDATTVREALLRITSNHDAIITTGGASRGEEDHLVSAVGDLGTRHIWQLAIKPGRPMNFGQVGDCIVLGLPGNPVAAMICFLLYGRPVLSALGGGEFLTPRRYQVPADFEVARKKPDRREFFRGILATGASGETVLRKFERDGSGLISSLRMADGLIEIPEETTRIERGQPVDFIAFTELGLLPRSI